MKSKINLMLLIAPLLSFAQIPSGYYNTAEDKADDVLKFELNQIIDNHTIFSYTSSITDTWDILKETDRDPNNSSNIILIYSGVSVDGAQEYNSGSGWTREHIWAKSRGDFGTAEGPGTQFLNAVFDDSDAVLSIEDNNQIAINQVQIYPNPTTAIININTTISIHKIALFDVLGKQVLSTNQTQQIDISHLPVGVYLLKAFSDTQTIIKKIIIK